MSRTLEKAFRVLANRERRQLLLALLEHNPNSDGSFEYPVNVPAPATDAHDEFHTRLRHSHLPMLEEAGFIEWHRDRRQVMKGPDFEQARPLLECLNANNTPLVP
jgi:hypothetical protein